MLNCDICSARCLSARHCLASLSAIFWRRLASLSLAFRDLMSSSVSDVDSPMTAIFVLSVWIAGVFVCLFVLKGAPLQKRVWAGSSL